MNYLFVAEKRSERAKKMGVYFGDGRLAGKQLFDALENMGLNPKDYEYVNLFERGGKGIVEKAKKEKKIIIALGNKVRKELERRNIQCIFVYHPAVRYQFRSKEFYFNHIKERLAA